jgi:hypothetical protein
MTKEQLAPWLEKLNRAEKKDRNGIAAEMSREHGLKPGEAWSLLKEAGFDPKAAAEDKPQAEAQKEPVTLRHTTEYPFYRRAGLLLSQKPKTYEVTKAQLAVLEKDRWVEIIKT